MKIQLVTLALMLAIASADISHLTNRNLPPNYHMQNNQNGMRIMMHYPQQQQQYHPSKGRVETTIEKHEVIELPTQIEIIKDGQPIYGVQRQPFVMARMSNNNNNIESVPEINARFLIPSQEIQDLQPPQIPYEMPMQEFLPPVEESTTADMPTTTMMPPATTYNPMMSSYDGETTTEQQSGQDKINNYIMTTEMPKQEPAYESTSTMPENRYLSPMPTPRRNQFLPSINMMMLPPVEPMPQSNFQKYQEQMMHEQQMQRMYREQEIQEVMNAIAEMQQQQMTAFRPTQPQQQQQMQPIPPAEPAYISREDSFNYKPAKAGDDVRRYRYRH